MSYLDQWQIMYLCITSAQWVNLSLKSQPVNCATHLHDYINLSLWIESPPPVQPITCTNDDKCTVESPMIKESNQSQPINCATQLPDCINPRTILETMTTTLLQATFSHVYDCTIIQGRHIIAGFHH